MQALFECCFLKFTPILKKLHWRYAPTWNTFRRYILSSLITFQNDKPIIITQYLLNET